MPHLGIGELVVILMLAILVFGAARLPKIGEDLGKTIRSFKRGLAGEDKIKVTTEDKPLPSIQGDRLDRDRAKSEVGGTEHKS